MHDCVVSLCVRNIDSLRSHFGFCLQDQARPTPQYVNADAESVQQRGMGVYAPVAAHPQPNRPQPFNPQQSPQQQQQPRQHGFEQPNGYYGGPQAMPTQQHVQAQVLPSGHTVYVNAPSPQHYGGYATIQYHPQSQQHHIVHQTLPPGVMPRASNEQQYISVVPIQGAGGHIQGVGPGGTYTYWQPPDGQPGGPQTMAIIPNGAGGVPVAVSHIGKPMSGPMGTPKSRQHHQQRIPPNGGRGKEKNGKGRHSNGKNQGRKSEGKTTTANGHSPGTLLDDFKNKKNNREWSVYDIKGHVVEFCQDQNGSRFVQQRLEVGDSQEKQIVVQELLPSVDQLRNDVFGNYVVQKLLDFGTDQMKKDLRDTMAGGMVPLSMQMYG